MFDFSAAVQSAVKTSGRNPWSVQVDAERESGLYIHPVSGEAISLGGLVVAALGKAGQTVNGNGVTFRDYVKAILAEQGQTFRSFRKISLAEKIALHAAIAGSAKPKRRRSK